MADVERITESDRALIVRMNTELAAADRLRQFVVGHLSAVYKLGDGDVVEDDGVIQRSAQSPEAER